MVCCVKQVTLFASDTMTKYISVLNFFLFACFFVSCPFLVLLIQEDASKSEKLSYALVAQKAKGKQSPSEPSSQPSSPPTEPDNVCSDQQSPTKSNKE